MPNEKNSAYCGELVGDDARARQLDHRPDVIVERRRPRSAITSSATALAASRVTCISSLRADARNHHVGPRVDAAALQVAGGLEDRAHLHRVDLRDREFPSGRRAGRASDSARAAAARAASTRPCSLYSGESLPLGEAQFGRLDEQIARATARTRAAADRADESSPDSPAIASRIPTKSSRWNGSSLVSASSRASGVVREDHLAARSAGDPAA